MVRAMLHVRIGSHGGIFEMINSVETEEATSDDAILSDEQLDGVAGGYSRNPWENKKLVHYSPWDIIW